MRIFAFGAFAPCRCWADRRWCFDRLFCAISTKSRQKKWKTASEVTLTRFEVPRTGAQRVFFGNVGESAFWGIFLGQKCVEGRFLGRSLFAKKRTKRTNSTLKSTKCRQKYYLCRTNTYLWQPSTFRPRPERMAEAMRKSIFAYRAERA